RLWQQVLLLPVSSLQILHAKQKRFRCWDNLQLGVSARRIQMVHGGYSNRGCTIQSSIRPSSRQMTAQSCRGPGVADGSGWVAAQRRALPPGGEVKKAYAFAGENGPVDFAGLFGDKNTLVVYNYMFGPQREKPCPMCTSLLSAWDGEVPDIMQRVALAVVAR